jgi:hypothetical protein
MSNSYKKTNNTLTRLLLEVRSSDFHGLFPPSVQLLQSVGFRASPRRHSSFPSIPCRSLWSAQTYPRRWRTFPRTHPSSRLTLWELKSGMDGIVVLETCTAYSRASETADFERIWNTRILLIFPRNVRFTSLFFTPKLVLESDPGIKNPRCSRTHNSRRSLHLCQTRRQQRPLFI